MDDDTPLAKGLRPTLAGAGSGEFDFRYNERSISDSEYAAKALRGITGKRHLPRYLAEFDFRYNWREAMDVNRAAMLLAGISGKRLTYRDSLPT